MATLVYLPAGLQLIKFSYIECRIQRAEKSIYSCATMDSRTEARPFPCKNGIVHRASKSIIQMLLQGYQMTAGGLQLSSFVI